MHNVVFGPEAWKRFCTADFPALRAADSRPGPLRSPACKSTEKTKGKTALPGPVKGGLGAPDTLYDSQLKLTGIPPLSDTEDMSPGEPPGPSDIRPVSILDEMKRSYLDYAMSVIVARALPDARDGLKPVHRRILYAMYENGFEWNKPYRKSARTVGDVIGKYHPHGDQSVYDAMVRMAQDFSMRVPLDRRAGQFRLGRRRYAGRDAVHRIPPDQDRAVAARRYRQGHRRFPAQLRQLGNANRRFCRRSSRTCWSMAPAASPSAWRPTFRRTIWAK